MNMTAYRSCSFHIPQFCAIEAALTDMASDSRSFQNLSDDELLRLLEEEAAKPILPPSDWKARAKAHLRRAEQILRESPMGRGTL